MKNILCILVFLLPLGLLSQNYVDLLKVSYSENFESSFENSTESTTVKSIDVDLTIPFVINENNVFITGVLYSRNNLELFPEPDFNLIDIDPETFPQYYKNVSLHNTILKLGIVSTFNEKWSGTFAFLPKLASDYQDISGDDFYLGGAVILKYNKSERLKYRVGMFATQQVFGWFTTPIVGFYYISEYSKFEMDVSLPVSADINYALNSRVKVGVNYFGIGRSFDVHQQNTPAYYVDYVALEFTSYAQYGFLNNSVLLRAKLGYSSITAEAFADGDDVDSRVLAFNIGGDNRQQLNPDLSNGFFGKLEAVYRFDIWDKK